MYGRREARNSLLGYHDGSAVASMTRLQSAGLIIGKVRPALIRIKRASRHWVRFEGHRVIEDFVRVVGEDP